MQVRAELGLALAAHVQSDAPALLRDFVDWAPSAEQRSELALSGARALGLAGHFEDAMELCRRGLEQAAGIPSELRARLEAELVCTAWLQATTTPEAHERLHRLAAPPPLLDPWRINAAWEAVRDGRAAGDTRALVASALESGALDADADSLLGTVATLVLIANEDLDAARDRCGALIDVARPRGWLTALAHGSFLRAIALVHAGQVRDAEGDARTSFDFKRANGPPAALIWSLFPLLDALTELGALDDAEAALAAGGRLADPPPGALGAPLLLESRARLPLAQRRHADAHADLRAAAARWQELDIHHPGFASWRVDAAQALVALGDTAAARALAEEHLELAERVGLPGPRGAGLRAHRRTRGGDLPARAPGRAARGLAGSA